MRKTTICALVRIEDFEELSRRYPFDAILPRRLAAADASSASSAVIERLIDDRRDLLKSPISDRALRGGANHAPYELEDDTPSSLDLVFDAAPCECEVS